MSSAFIPPMLASRLADDRLLTDARFVAEPKLDGQRAQVHVQAGRAIACYSRPGRARLDLPGLRWLCAVRWPSSRRPDGLPVSPVSPGSLRGPLDPAVPRR